ncbi:hypothetical protein [Granulicella mallensis]|uniref:Glycoside hydrolase family 5 n=1 Tax=Granulicella mallensis TaxID=940614 RepID=A0A7W7ZL04_9BACT|nr:hypothetical protein [Granulicella mallensis]MBB5061851.1 hypothetical protein [Granulicella mallensis]
MTTWRAIWLGFLTAAGLQVAAINATRIGAQSPQQSQADMSPFTMELRRGALTHSPVDVSYLLDAPAGKHGFVQVKDGHLATGEGKRIRFWGVNITDWSKGSRQIPVKQDAAFLASTLARFGVNSVRFQFLDLEVSRGLIAKQGDSTRMLDVDALDREDYFIAELEKRGIYIDFNLLVGRPFHAGDGVKNAELLREGSKGTSLYDARMIELQKEYARQLLTHLNPYTKLRYTDDPAVAIVEINNENAINVGFHAPAPFYQDELTGLYNQWLAKHRTAEQSAKLREITSAGAADPVPLLSSKTLVAEAPPERFYAEAEFYNDLQHDYFLDMERYLKQTLGSHSLVIATADHSHSNSGYSILLATEDMDIIDGHTYWQHPEYYVKKLPMVNDPFNSTIVELSRSAIAGKPYTVSEVNNPFPNDYAGEGIPILAAYAGLQDWDALFWYTFEPKSDPAWKPYVGDAFDISLDPVKMPELAAGALLFLRGDVEKARTVSERTYSEKQVFDSMLIPSTERPYYTEGFPLALPLEHEVRIGSLTGPPTKPFETPKATDPIVSDTRQLAWYVGPQHTNGLVTVDTPRSQALIGFVKAQGKSVRNMSAEVNNSFCILLLSAMDEQPIATSAKLLLVAGGPVENTGQQWNTAGTDVTSFGGPPSLVEPVKGTITLNGLEGAHAVWVQPIDGAGQPLGKPTAAANIGGTWKVPLGPVTTTWYEIRVER